MTITLPESPKGCPMDALLRLIKGHWTPYIVWTLSTKGTLRFGALKREVAGISAKMLTERLRLLERAGIVHRHYETTIPPQVSYGLTDAGRELAGALDQLYVVACHWQDAAGDGQPAGDSA